VILEQDEDGIFIARVPELPGRVSCGKTKDEALKNIREAIEGYLETLRDEGWPLPSFFDHMILRGAMPIS
jgi:antitoxin HicB